MPIVSTVPFLSRKTQQLHEQWNNNHPYCSINNFPSKLEAHSSRKKWKWKVQGVGSYTRNYMAQFHKPHSNTNNFTDSFIKTRGSRNENQIEDSHKQYLPITWDRGPPESLSKSPSTLCFSLPSCFVFLFLSIPTLVQIFSSPEPARSPLLIFLKLLKFFILFGSFQKPISSNSFLPQSPSGFLSQSLFFSYFSPSYHYPFFLISQFNLSCSHICYQLHCSWFNKYIIVPTTTMARWWSPQPCVPCILLFWKPASTPKTSYQLFPGVRKIPRSKRGLQICPSSVEFTSVRNMNTRVNKKCE